MKLELVLDMKLELVLIALIMLLCAPISSEAQLPPCEWGVKVFQPFVGEFCFPIEAVGVPCRICGEEIVVWG